MQLIDGKQLSQQIKSEIAEDVKQLTHGGKRPPHLAAVLVGDDPASGYYVKSKMRSCEEVGFKSTLIRETSDISQEALLKIIADLNADEGLDGYIVQLPLPDHIEADKINLAIDPSKDVDGFHPTNIGKMVLGMPTYLPATPQGILTMFRRYEIPTSGKYCVVLGRSNIVGRPISVLLSQKRPYGNATVQLCHSRTPDLAAQLRKADIIIAAIGKPEFVTAEMVKPGAVVIDVGINRVDDPSKKRGYRLCGDVHFESVAPRCSYITPVPGGVGPMTVTSLIMNTLAAYKGLGV